MSNFRSTPQRAVKDVVKSRSNNKKKKTKEENEMKGKTKANALVETIARKLAEKSNLMPLISSGNAIAENDSEEVKKTRQDQGSEDKNDESDISQHKTINDDVKTMIKRKTTERWKKVERSLVATKKQLNTITKQKVNAATKIQAVVRAGMARMDYRIAYLQNMLNVVDVKHQAEISAIEANTEDVKNIFQSALQFVQEEDRQEREKEEMLAKKQRDESIQNLKKSNKELQEQLELLRSECTDIRKANMQLEKKLGKVRTSKNEKKQKLSKELLLLEKSITELQQEDQQDLKRHQSNQKVRILYQHYSISIVYQVKEKCEDKVLVEHVVSLALRCEDEVQVLRARVQQQVMVQKVQIPFDTINVDPTAIGNGWYDDVSSVSQSQMTEEAEVYIYLDGFDDVSTLSRSIHTQGPFSSPDDAQPLDTTEKFEQTQPQNSEKKSSIVGTKAPTSGNKQDELSVYDWNKHALEINPELRNKWKTQAPLITYEDCVLTKEEETEHEEPLVDTSVEKVVEAHPQKSGETSPKKLVPKKKKIGSPTRTPTQGNSNDVTKAKTKLVAVADKGSKNNVKTKAASIKQTAQNNNNNYDATKTETKKVAVTSSPSSKGANTAEAVVPPIAGGRPGQKTKNTKKETKIDREENTSDERVELAMTSSPNSKAANKAEAVVGPNAGKRSGKKPNNTKTETNIDRDANASDAIVVPTKPTNPTKPTMRTPTQKGKKIADHDVRGSPKEKVKSKDSNKKLDAKKPNVHTDVTAKKVQVPIASEKTNPKAKTTTQNAMVERKTSATIPTSTKDHPKDSCHFYGYDWKSNCYKLLEPPKVLEPSFGYDWKKQCYTTVYHEVEAPSPAPQQQRKLDSPSHDEIPTSQQQQKLEPQYPLQSHPQRNMKRPQYYQTTAQQPRKLQHHQHMRANDYYWNWYWNHSPYINGGGYWSYYGPGVYKYGCANNRIYPYWDHHLRTNDRH